MPNSDIEKLHLPYISTQRTRLKRHSESSRIATGIYVEKNNEPLKQAKQNAQQKTSTQAQQQHCCGRQIKLLYTLPPQKNTAPPSLPHRWVGQKTSTKTMKPRKPRKFQHDSNRSLVCDAPTYDYDHTTWFKTHANAVPLSRTTERANHAQTTSMLLKFSVSHFFHPASIYGYNREGAKTTSISRIFQDIS